MTTKTAGLWHYIKVFCTFFCLIASFAAAMTLTEVRTSYGGYIAFFWILGVISAILVAPGQFFRFGCKIMAVCATFGGGGHVRAAGCSLRVPTMEDAVNAVAEAILRAMEK